MCRVWFCRNAGSSLAVFGLTSPPPRSFLSASAFSLLFYSSTSTPLHPPPPSSFRLSLLFWLVFVCLPACCLSAVGSAVAPLYSLRFVSFRRYFYLRTYLPPVCCFPLPIAQWRLDGRSPAVCCSNMSTPLSIPPLTNIVSRLPCPDSSPTTHPPWPTAWERKSGEKA